MKSAKLKNRKILQYVVISSTIYFAWDFLIFLIFLIINLSVKLMCLYKFGKQDQDL